MKKAYTLLAVGVWVAVLPYLGFSYFWKDILTTVSGFGLMFFSYMLYKRFKKDEIKKEKIFDNFSENKFENEKEIK